MRKVYYILGSFFLFGCSGLQKQNLVDNDLCTTQLIQPVEKVSLNNAEKITAMHGRFIMTEGLFRYNFEDVALYPYKGSHSKDAIWLNFVSSNTMPDTMLDRLNERNVIIVGRVNVLRKGHDNAYLATFDSVFCIRQNNGRHSLGSTNQ